MVCSHYFIGLPPQKRSFAIMIAGSLFLWQVMNLVTVILHKKFGKKNIRLTQVPRFCLLVKMQRPIVLLLGLWGAVLAYQPPAVLVAPPVKHSYGINKATSVHLFMLVGPRTFFDNPQGLATTKLISRDDPDEKGDDDEVVVYGVNAGKHEIIYNTSMWGLSIFGQKGHGAEEFFHPRGIVTDRWGNCFVADSGNGRVVRLFNPKKKLQWVSAYTDSLRGPTQLALGSDSTLFILDAAAGKIKYLHWYRDSVARELEVPLEGQSSALALADGKDPFSWYQFQNSLYYIDKDLRRLNRFDLRYKRHWSVMLPEGSQGNWAAVDHYHQLWVVDTKNEEILKFDYRLKFLARFGKDEDGKSIFDQPRGIAIHKRFGQVFIAEKKGAHYYWIGTKLAGEVQATQEQSYVRVKLFAQEPSYVRLGYVIDADSVVNTKPKMVLSKQSSLVFKIADSLNTSQLFLRVEPTYSSYTHIYFDYPIHLK